MLQTKIGVICEIGLSSDTRGLSQKSLQEFNRDLEPFYRISRATYQGHSSEVNLMSRHLLRGCWRAWTMAVAACIWASTSFKKFPPPTRPIELPKCLTVATCFISHLDRLTLNSCNLEPGGCLMVMVRDFILSVLGTRPIARCFLPDQTGHPLKQFTTLTQHNNPVNCPWS